MPGLAGANGFLGSVKNPAMIVSVQNAKFVIVEKVFVMKCFDL